MAEHVHGQLPPLEQDLYWGQSDPKVPHTRASIKHRDKIFGGHLANFHMDKEEQEMVDPASFADQETDDERKALKNFRELFKRMKFNSPHQVYLNMLTFKNGKYNQKNLKFYKFYLLNFILNFTKILSWLKICFCKKD